MRKPWNHQPSGPPLPLLIFCIVGILALIVVLGKSSSSASQSGVSNPVADVYRNYRRMREEVADDLFDIMSLSMRTTQTVELDFCGKEREHYVPCHNVSANRLAGFGDGEEFDRHCEVSGVGPRCLVRPPKDYKIPMKWPLGGDIIWSGNLKLTKDQFLASGSITKRQFFKIMGIFSFMNVLMYDGRENDGVEDYSHQIAKMIGLRSDSEFLQAGVHTVLDIGCGFGSFGAHLLSLNIMTMCIAAYEVSGSQVQIALERGLPAMIGSFSSKQLPYPSLSFDMVHCAQCGIMWNAKAFLVEVDRLLKPGGYFVLTSPHRGALLNGKNRNVFLHIEGFTKKICWNPIAQQDETFVWQKTTDIHCYASRRGIIIPLCEDVNNLESYYQPLLSCVMGNSSTHWIPRQKRTYQHADFELKSDELSLHGILAEDFLEDSQFWRAALKNYWSLLTPLIFSDHPKRPGEEDPLPPFNMIRNVMDMNSHYGGLNAALLEARKSVWVMNVVPIRTPNLLPLIFDRGFTGILHDWCKPFPTYPRTYDMLHAAGLLSHILISEECDMSDIFLEMDRILRPEGWVILRDKTRVIEKAYTFAAQNRWDARVIALQDDNDQQLLVCQKPFLKK
ncbi:hypothetical protein ACLOJK_002456 [Asimina triloba]